MAIDTDSIADEAVPERPTAAALGGAAAVVHARTEKCGEARAADDTHDAERAEAEPIARPRCKRLVYTVLPVLTLTLTLGVGYLKWQDGSTQLSQAAAVQATQVATESIIAMLSYAPDTVDKNLPAVSNRLTGKFRDQYTDLINDVVIPGAKQKRVSAVAKVLGAAPISATSTNAVVLAFVDQTITIGDDAPTDNPSSVRVTLDKVHDRWLISQFEPI